MLVIGPFAVLLLFGLGYDSTPAPIKTILVLPPDLNLPTDVNSYKDQFIPPFQLDEVTKDQAAAVNQLAHRKVNAVVLFPPNAQQTIAGGHQATIQVLYNSLDPLQRSWLTYYSYVQTNELNRQVLIQALKQQGQGDGGPTSILAAAVLTRGQNVPPEVLVSPFKSDGKNIAPTTPGYVEFFAPGVLALLVQHIAVTFTALALVRERLRGAIEVFRVSPVSAREIIFGKYVSYFLQTALLAIVLAVVMRLVLHVPIIGRLDIMALALGLLIAASLGLGFLISAVSATETQAVQLSLLILVASVFFSGFLVAIQNLLPAVRVVSYLLPVTYGIQALQLVMLRGEFPATWQLLGLGGIAVVTVLGSLVFFQSAFRQR